MTAAAGERIDALLGRMGGLLEPMVEAEDPRRYFLAVYMRTTAAVRSELADPQLGGFVDPAWTEAWDLSFADLYLEALERWNEDGSAPGPWQVAFGSAATRLDSTPSIASWSRLRAARRTGSANSASLITASSACGRS